MEYTIGEMSARMGVPPTTLRYYDKVGLLPFVERSNSGLRIFSDKDYTWLHTIECLKKTGMSLRDIKIFIDWCIEGDATIERRKELIEKRRQAVLEEIAQLQETLAMLEYKKWYYETALQAGTCSIHDNTDADHVPEQYRQAYLWGKSAKTKKQG